MSEDDDAPFSRGSLRYLFINIHSFDAALTFYRDLLGFHLNHLEPGKCAFMSVGSRGEGPDIVLLCGAQRIHDKQPASMIVIDVPDIDATVERLRRRGVSVGAIHKVPFGRAAMIEDPDGNVLEVHQPSKPLASNAT